MIYEINIKYCEINDKYDSFINGKFTGKWYTLEEALKGLTIQINRR